MQYVLQRLPLPLVECSRKMTLILQFLDNSSSDFLLPFLFAEYVVRFTLKLVYAWKVSIAHAFTTGQKSRERSWYKISMWIHKR